MKQETDIADERHPLRFLVKFAVFVGVLYFGGRFLAQKKDEFAGLTESEARDKLIEKMGPRIGDDTAGDIADQVIPKLKDRGLIKTDPVEAAAKKVEETAEKTADAVEEKTKKAADTVSDAVDSVVKD